MNNIASSDYSYDQNDLILEEQQLALYKALQGLNQKYAYWYLSVCYILRSKNPDSISLAAHNLREIMEKLPRDLLLPIKLKKYDLKSQVLNLQCVWDKVLKEKKWSGNTEWKGKIDNKLKSFLKKLDGFFKDFSEARPKREEQLKKLLRKLDKFNGYLPESIESIRFEEWDLYWKIFVDLAHHKETIDEKEFIKYLRSFERFLLDKFYPRTFIDISKIDELIEKGEKQ